MATRGKPPKLKASSISSYLEKRYGVSLKDADFQKPTTAMMKRVFEAIVHNYAGFCKMDQLPAIEEALKEHCPDPELHEDSLPSLVFHGAVVSFTLRAGMDDFSLKDIYNPEPQRTLQVLSSAVSYARYKSQHETDFLSNLNSVMDPLFVETRGLQDGISEMRGALAELQEKHSAEEPLVKTIMEDITAMGQEALRLQGQRESVAEENDNGEDDIRRLEEQVNSVKQGIVEAKQETMALNRQVVESPERLQSNLEELSARFGEMEGQKEDMKKELQGMTEKRRNLAKAVRKVNKVKALMDNVEKEHHAQKEARMRVKAIEDQIAAMRRRLAMLEAQQETDSRAMAAKSEKAIQSRQEIQNKEAFARRELEKKLMERQSVEQSKGSYEALLAEKENKVKSLQSMEQVVAAGHQEKKALRDRLCYELLSAVQERKQLLLAASANAPSMLSAAAVQCREALLQ